MEYVGSGLDDHGLRVKAFKEAFKKLDEDIFIAETTSSFLGCIKWRTGDTTQLGEIQRQLQAVDDAVDTPLELYTLLSTLDRTARGYEGRASGDYKTALANLLQRVGDAMDTLQQTTSYKDARRRADEEQRRLAEERERLRLEGLASLDGPGRVEAFIRQYGANPGTLNKLLAGTADLSGSALLTRLTANFATIGFTYSMRNSRPEVALGASPSGDCSTLSKAMQLICLEIFQIPAKVEGCADLLVDSDALTIDASRPPTGTTFWVFANHYWVAAGGATWDPLFGRAKSEDGWVRITSQADLKPFGVTYEVYGTHKVVKLFGSGYRHIKDITKSEWTTHCSQANVTKTVEELLVAISEL